MIAVDNIFDSYFVLGFFHRARTALRATSDRSSDVSFFMRAAPLFSGRQFCHAF
jgi:hypothetical protein